MGLAVATLLVVPRAWLVLFAITPVAFAAGSLSYLIFKNTPFMQRVTDPNDLFSRFVYWVLAVKMIVAHPLIGIGHMQFKTFYLDYVQDTSNFAHFDIAKVPVADNMYLTTAVEHGVLGVLTLLGLLFLGAVILKRYRNALLAKGLIRQASFVRCSEMALAIYAATGFFADLNQFTRATKYVFILVGTGRGRWGALRDTHKQGGKHRNGCGELRRFACLQTNSPRVRQLLYDRRRDFTLPRVSRQHGTSHHLRQLELRSGDCGLNCFRQSLEPDSPL